MTFLALIVATFIGFVAGNDLVPEWSGVIAFSGVIAGYVIGFVDVYREAMRKD